jgi:hypothetical protein
MLFLNSSVEHSIKTPLRISPSTTIVPATVNLPFNILCAAFQIMVATDIADNVLRVVLFVTTIFLLPTASQMA